MEKTLRQDWWVLSIGTKEPKGDKESISILSWSKVFTMKKGNKSVKERVIR